MYFISWGSPFRLPKICPSRPPRILSSRTSSGSSRVRGSCGAAGAAQETSSRNAAGMRMTPPSADERRQVSLGIERDVPRRPGRLEVGPFREVVLVGFRDLDPDQVERVLDAHDAVRAA